MSLQLNRYASRICDFFFLTERIEPNRRHTNNENVVANLIHVIKFIICDEIPISNDAIFLSAGNKLSPEKLICPLNNFEKHILSAKKIFRYSIFASKQRQLCKFSHRMNVRPYLLIFFFSSNKTWEYKCILHCSPLLWIHFASKKKKGDEKL